MGQQPILAVVALLAIRPFLSRVGADQIFVGHVEANQAGQEQTARPLQLELNRVIVNGVHTFDAGDQVSEALTHLLEAVEAVDHVAGHQLAAVVELDPLTQLEGVAQAVVRDLPGLGQPGVHPSGSIGEDQRVVNVSQRCGAGVVIAHGGVNERRPGKSNSQSAWPFLGSRFLGRCFFCGWGCLGCLRCFGFRWGGCRGWCARSHQ